MAMKVESQVNLILIASGGGTDAFAIMDPWEKGWIPEIGNIVLISTHANAGCLEKATSCGVEAVTLVPPSIPLDLKDYQRYGQKLWGVVAKYQAELILLVGCRVVLPLIPGIPMYNIHPADTNLHGGNGMHSLKPHTHVLEAILDQIKRGKKRLDRDRFFTYPTVHEVTAVPDDGPPLLQGSVEIPKELLQEVLEGKCSLHDAAQHLQKLVLPYEWLMLPTSVRRAAAMILNKRE